MVESIKNEKFCFTSKVRNPALTAKILSYSNPFEDICLQMTLMCKRSALYLDSNRDTLTEVCFPSEKRFYPKETHEIHLYKVPMTHDYWVLDMK